jgi:hypothetical protein
MKTLLVSRAVHEREYLSAMLPQSLVAAAVPPNITSLHEESVDSAH